MLQNVEGIRDTTLRRETGENARKENDHGKRKRDRASISKLKVAAKKKTRNDEMDFGDLEGEEMTLIK